MITGLAFPPGIHFKETIAAAAQSIGLRLGGIGSE